MSETDLVVRFQILMEAVMIIALPPLLIAMVLGLIVGILQAATQIQDQTLPLTVKLVAVALVLILLGPMLASPLLRESQRIFDEFPALIR